MSEIGVAVATGWTALRAAVIAPCAIAAGIAIAAEMQRTSSAGRRIFWGLLLASILSPDLVAGYGYRNFSLSLARHPAWNEAFLTLLIGLKAAAVAAVMLYFTPPPALSPSARHLLTLGQVPWPARLPILMREGPLVRCLPALAVAFLFAFQQFELPSLTGAVAWTVTLFDRQAMLPDLSDSADSLVWPLLVELLVLAPLIGFIMRARAANRRAVAPSYASRSRRAAAWSSVCLIAALTVVLPFGLLLRQGLLNVGYVFENAPNIVAFWKEVAIAAGYGLGAAAVAYFIATRLLRRLPAAGGRAFAIVLLVVACIPGLCGPLLASLVAVELLQQPPLLVFRDSLVPLILVLALFLLPRAVLLESLAWLIRRGEAIATAKQLRASTVRRQRNAGRSLLWRLEGFGRYCRFSLLAYWGYLDLTAATILAPPGVVPVSARLYNLMHYGHNAALSAMTLVAVVAPLAAFLIVLAGRRLVLRVFA